jgi:translocation protein SEC62
MREPYKKSAKRPKIESREQAEKYLADLHLRGFFLRVEKTPKSKALNLVQVQQFSPDGYFIWVYEGPQWKGTLIGLGILGIAFAGVMFPLWPAPLRLGVYYLSLAFLGLMGVFFGMVVVRFILWLVLVVATGRGGWLFPNLFEDVGIVESFIPLWG